MKTTTKATNASADMVQSAITALEKLRGQMTYLTPLSPEERRELRGSRMGPRAWSLLQGRVEAARQHRELLPPTFDLRQFEREVELVAGLRSCLGRLDQLRDDVSDTLHALGTRVLQDGALVYGHIKVAASAKQSLHQAVNKLASRRGRKRPTNPGAPPTPSPASGSEPTKEMVSEPAPDEADAPNQAAA